MCGRINMGLHQQSRISKTCMQMFQYSQQNSTCYMKPGQIVSQCITRSMKQHVFRNFIYFNSPSYSCKQNYIKLHQFAPTDQSFMTCNTWETFVKEVNMHGNMTSTANSKTSAMHFGKQAGNQVKFSPISSWLLFSNLVPGEGNTDQLVIQTRVIPEVVINHLLCEIHIKTD